MDRPRSRPVPSQTPDPERSGFNYKARAVAQPVNRHSRFVAWMKIGLPVAAVLLLAGLLLSTGVFNRRDKLDVSFSEVATKNDDLRMVSPRVTGLNKDGQPYTLTADTATQDLKMPNHVVMENIAAEMKIDEANGWMKLQATSGLLDSEAQILSLRDNINLTTTLGYAFHATQADINFKAGTMSSPSAISGDGPLGAISADSMSANNAEQTLRFDGHVKLRIEGEQLTRKGEEGQP